MITKFKNCNLSFLLLDLWLLSPSHTHLYILFILIFHLIIFVFYGHLPFFYITLIPVSILMP